MSFQTVKPVEASSNPDCKNSLVVTSTGCTTSEECLLRRGATSATTFAVRKPSSTTTYIRRYLQTESANNSCYLYGQQSRASEPSEYVTGMIDSRPVDVQKRRRPSSSRPVEDASMEEEITRGGQLAVSTIYNSDYKLFYGQSPEPHSEISGCHR